MDKKTACFLLLGFLLVAYGHVNIVGVTVIAAVLVAIILFNTNLGATSEVKEGDDNEF